MFSVPMQRPEQVKILDTYAQTQPYLLFSSTVFLYAANDPIIESSNNLKFAPYNVAYPFLDEHVKAVGFDTSNNIVDNLYDVYF